MSTPDRRAKLDRTHATLSVRRQCTLLGLARSGVYRAKTPANENDLVLTRRLDEMFTQWPFLGSPSFCLAALEDALSGSGGRRSSTRIKARNSGRRPSPAR